MAHGDITHIDIPVTDLSRSTTFYGELFGWRIAEAPGFEGYPNCSLRCTNANNCSSHASNVSGTAFRGFVRS